MAVMRRLCRRDLLRTLKWAVVPAALALAGCDPAAIRPAGPSKVQVALLVPSGASDPQVVGIADSMTKAAQLAVAGLEQPLIDLRVYSTAGEASVAAASAQQALNDGADVILGPLYAPNAAAVGRVAAPTNTAVVAFSNNTDVAGGNVFVSGNTFENIAGELGRFAASRGKTRVFVIFADTPAERFARSAIGRGLAGTGVQVVGQASFAPSMESMIAALPGIADQVKASDADALFLTTNTDGGLRELSNFLPDHGLSPDDYQYIGLGRWDRPQSATALPGLQGGWFALPDPGATAEFNKLYIDATEAAPFPLAQLAYDGILAMARQASIGGPSAVTPAALTLAAPFDGVGGTFSYQTNGTVRREMTIATLRNKSVSILKQARSNLVIPGS